MRLHEVIPQIHHAVGIVNVSIGGDFIVGRTAILGDQDVVHIPDFL